MHLIINGGGLVGAFAALLLQQHCDKITVVEKRSDLRKATAESGRSINLVLTSRGLFALRSLGLEQKALQISVPVEGRLMHQLAPGGSDNAPTAPVFQPYGVSKAEVNYSVSRTALNQLLIEEGVQRGIEYVFETALVKAQLGGPTEDGKVSLVYQRHGEASTFTLEADAVFGTDGVGSSTRATILEHLRQSGLAPEAKDEVQRLGISYKELTFPADPQTDEYIMEGRGLHIWPRGAHFLMALADLKNTFTGTLYLPDGSAPLDNIPGIETVPTFDDLANDREKVDAYVRQYYPDVPAIVPDYLEQLTGRHHSFLGTIRSTNWHYGGKALVFGDAAHGVVPFFGQGMNLGFESAIVLERFIRQAGCLTGCDAAARAAIFSAFEAHHHKSADALADMAIENFAEMSYKVGQPAFLQRKHMEHAAEAAAPAALRSRYYMVTKTLIPYALVQEAGPFVDACVEALLRRYAEKGIVEDFDGKISAADVVAVAEEKGLTAFLNKHNIAVGEPLRDYYPS